MAHMFATCTICFLPNARVTFIHGAPQCIDKCSRIVSAPSLTNIGNLDQFYIDAFAGIDYETGEVYDPTLSMRT